MKNLSGRRIEQGPDSIIVSDTIIKKLVDIGFDPKEVWSSVLRKPDPVWRKTDSAPGELKNFLTAAILLLDGGGQSEQLRCDKVSKIVQALGRGRGKHRHPKQILSHHRYRSQASQGNDTRPAGAFTRSFTCPNLRTMIIHGPAGEMKRFVLAADILLKDAGDDELENLEQIKLGTFAGENQKRMLASEIVKETIIRNIEIEAEKPGAVLKIAPELDRSASGYQQEAWNNELPLLLDAIIAILGEDAKPLTASPSRRRISSHWKIPKSTQSSLPASSATPPPRQLKATPMKRIP